ncbi:4'-phosphopantetheinyl transferase family protein [Halpernia sp. GG3]
MEVWVAYSFLNKNNSEKIEHLFNKLPESLVMSVALYKNIDDRLGRMTSKLLLEILVKKILPQEDFFWDLYKKDSLSKPYFDGLNISFNSSHTEELSVVCAVRNGKCGIDTEINKSVDINLYNDFLHEKERKLLSEQNNPLVSFYEIWVKKEASLKASGLGLTEDLAKIDAHQNFVLINKQKYFTKSLELSPNHSTYIATKNRVGKINLEEIIF